MFLDGKMVDYSHLRHLCFPNQQSRLNQYETYLDDFHELYRGYEEECTTLPDQQQIEQIQGSYLLQKERDPQITKLIQAHQKLGISQDSLINDPFFETSYHDYTSPIGLHIPFDPIKLNDQKGTFDKQNLLIDKPFSLRDPKIIPDLKIKERLFNDIVLVLELLRHFKESNSEATEDDITSFLLQKMSKKYLHLYRQLNPSISQQQLRQFQNKSFQQKIKI